MERGVQPLLYNQHSADVIYNENMERWPSPAEGARLEIVCVARHRGFESHSLRQVYRGFLAYQIYLRRKLKL